MSFDSIPWVSCVMNSYFDDDIVAVFDSVFSRFSPAIETMIYSRSHPNHWQSSKLNQHTNFVRRKESLSTEDLFNWTHKVAKLSTWIISCNLILCMWSSGGTKWWNQMSAIPQIWNIHMAAIHRVMQHHSLPTNKSEACKWSFPFTSVLYFNLNSNLSPIMKSFKFYRFLI